MERFAERETRWLIDQWRTVTDELPLAVDMLRKVRDGCDRGEIFIEDLERAEDYVKALTRDLDDIENEMNRRGGLPWGGPP